VDYGATVEHLSLAVAIVLIVSYALGLLFSLKTHRALFNPQHEEAAGEPREDEEEEARRPWSTRRAVGALAIAGVAVGVMSEILVGSISEAAHSIGLSEFFVGVIVVAIVGNAAEHWVAVLVAAKDKMDLAVGIAIGSSAQIALFAIPLLVVASFFLGPGPMALVFNGFELGALIIAVLVAMHVTNEGESTWFEGVQLLAVYIVLALGFFFA
jgi:Ca2+:H+ antiporter